MTADSNGISIAAPAPALCQVLQSMVGAVATVRLTRCLYVQEGVKVQEVGLYVLRGDHVYAAARLHRVYSWPARHGLRLCRGRYVVVCARGRAGAGRLWAAAKWQISVRCVPARRDTSR